MVPSSPAGTREPNDWRSTKSYEIEAWTAREGGREDGREEGGEGGREGLNSRDLVCITNDTLLALSKSCALIREKECAIWDVCSVFY